MKYKEYPVITLEMLVRTGVITPGTKVQANWHEKVTGELTEQGGILLIVNGEKKLYPYPSGAARSIVGRSVNGWIFWKIKIGNDYKPLSYLKELYIKQFGFPAIES